MGDVRPRTKAELAELERDQEDPKWLDWVNPERMESQLAKFLTETIPDMPDDPWSAEGLDRAEREILNRFATMDDAESSENRDLADQFTRYIGEVFCRKFEGRWHNVRGTGGARYPEFGPAVDREWSEMYLDVANLVTATVHRHWGDYLSTIFNNNARGHQDWVDSGRPPIAERIEE
ncbi:hypothetical protein [Nocardia miyunensis]|uniref:hypothetical protein n=1 Tax=Nocardia miyunensis TaxID=282684 RepID=UPI00082979B0|nr:hypothetical protein [Nocardia miyunensis]